MLHIQETREIWKNMKLMNCSIYENHYTYLYGIINYEKTFTKMTFYYEGKEYDTDIYEKYKFQSLKNYKFFE